MARFFFGKEGGGEEVLAAEVFLGGLLDAVGGKGGDAFWESKDAREGKLVFGGVGKVGKPEGVFFEAAFVIAQVGFLDFAEVVWGRAFGFEFVDSKESGGNEFVDFVGIASEGDLNGVAAFGVAGKAAGDAHAVNAAFVFAQHFAQADLKDVNSALESESLFRRPRSVAVEGEADGAFGFYAFFDLDLDFACCFGVANVFGFFVSGEVG